MKKADHILKLLCCMLPCLLLYTGLFSQQNFSGLLNKELSPEMGKDELIGGLVDRLLYGGSFTGSVTTVKVLDDRDVSLTVAVNYVGYKEGYIHVTVADGNLSAIPSFPVQKVPIDKDKKEAVLTLQFDRKAYPENQSFNVPMLVVLVSKSDKGTHGVRTTYKLNKKFMNPLSPENVILPAALTPVGSAASLPATLPSNDVNFKVILPKRNVYDDIKYKQAYLYKVDTAVTKRAVSTARPAVYMAPAATAATVDKKVIMKPDVRAVSVLSTPVFTASPSGPAPPAVNKDPQGPKDQPYSFWGDFIYSDVDFESQNQITSISLTIYPDKNEHSGVFYYLPIAYDIKFDKEKGFAFNMDYGTVRESGTENKVRMSGTLTSGISLYEIQFIKNLMEAYRKQNPGLKFEKPLPLPISETPVITLGDELKNFGITNVNINNASSITDPVEFSWMTDGTTAAELENLLKANSGIIGKMKIKPQGTTLGTQEIPVRIRLIDENTFGRFGMTPAEFRTKNWRNETPFPIRLKYVHYMIIDKNRDGKESPIIYSWDLANKEVPSQNQVKFNTGVIPQWLDNYKGKQARIWLEYSVVDTCSPCNEKVFRGIVNSTTRPQLSDVVFRIIPFFDEYKVSYMDIEVKSVQGDPSGRSEVSFPAVHITRDSTDYVAGKIYVPSGTEPSFEYRITIVTKEGNEMKSAWTRRNSLSVPFGSFQLKEQFPSFNK